MKKVFLLFGIIIALVILLGADIRRQKEASALVVEDGPCYGYTIVEFGKGIDCNGDTVALVKVKGGQELARIPR